MFYCVDITKQGIVTYDGGISCKCYKSAAHTAVVADISDGHVVYAVERHDRLLVTIYCFCSNLCVTKVIFVTAPAPIVTLLLPQEN